MDEQNLHPEVRRVQKQYLAGLTPPMQVRDLQQPRAGSLSPFSPAQKVLSPYCRRPSNFTLASEQAQEHSKTKDQ